MEGMRERLESLEEEFARGERKLRELQAHEQDLREMLLRLSGAISVLRECVGSDSVPAQEEHALVE
jgi:hypothetical protein